MFPRSQSIYRHQKIEIKYGASKNTRNSTDENITSICKEEWERAQCSKEEERTFSFYLSFYIEEDSQLQHGLK